MKEKLDKIFSDNQGEVTQEMILRYVNGTATPGERRLIEEQMADDPFLSDAVEGIMKAGNAEKVKQDLERITSEIKSKTNPRTRKIIPLKRWLQVAAALVILTSTIWFVNNRIHKSTEKIFTEEFEPYPVPKDEQPALIDTDAPAKVEEHFTPLPEKTTQAKKEADKTEKPIVKQQESIPENEIEENASSTATRTQDIESPAVAAEDDQSADVSLMEAKKDKYAADSVQIKNKTTEASNSYFAEPSSISPQSLSDVVVTQQKKPSAGEVAKQQADYEKKTLLNDALDWYHQENYPEAISRFELILQKDANNEAANFYAGVSYLAMNNPDEALDKLKRIDSKKEGPYYEAALWYESLAYVQKGEKKNAINILEKVVKLNGEHKVKAEDLLTQLQ